MKRFVRRSRLLWLVPVIAGIVAAGLIGVLIGGPPPAQASASPARPSIAIASPLATGSPSRSFRAWPTAQAPVTAYLSATGAGDSKAALNIWVGSPVDIFSDSRRVRRTEELAGLRVGPGYAITTVVYQASTTVVEREADATFASLIVMAKSQSGVAYQLIFMVAREAPGSAAPLGVAGGDWTLYDVIHFGECTELGC